MRSRTPTDRLSIRDEPPRSAWYRQPVLWLGALLFAASLAGCVWMIVLGARHADAPIDTGAVEVFKMPLTRPAPVKPETP